MKEAKRYDKIFKQTIVKLYKKGKSITDLSREQSIGSWIKLSKKVGKLEGEELSYKELLELRKKVRDLERDNEILKKGLAIFAQMKEKE